MNAFLKTSRLISDHIGCMQARGITIELTDDGKRLHVYAEFGAMTDADRQFIAANCDLIFRHLSGEREQFIS